MKVAVALFSLVAAHLASLQVVEAQKDIVVDEMAPYEVIKQGQGYEERYYPPARWVCHGKSFPRPTMSKMQQSFFPLFYYITGNNMGDLEIPMTAPVTMKTTEEADGKWQTQMCFYLPEAHQVDAPAPNDAEVYIEDRPAMTVFVRRTGGFITRAAQWDYQAMQLKQALEGKEPAADFSTFYMAGYDSPMQFENRRNEVWFMKKETM